MANATEQRLIDANTLEFTPDENGIANNIWIGGRNGGKIMELVLSVLKKMIEGAPTIDAVEVVRCKDCRFSAQNDPYDAMECVKWATKWGVTYTTPDGFCHKGERISDHEPLR